MNGRFDLNSLPMCGAKTRHGIPCKRKGNKKNGRCKLHGGHATGAKTELGQLASRANAQKDFPDWFFGKPVKTEYVIRALSSYEKLVELMLADEIDWDTVFDVVEQDQIPLEMLKYYIMFNVTPEALIIIQSALDTYYQETHAPHLAFHVYAPMIVFHKFFRQLSAPDREYLANWFKKYSSRHPGYNW
ncbi:hypothetical protein C9I92_23225 [Photobacterium ganghwense]|uniref:Uncharacterized protein n=1 Tax=Photobacterium ganghwense TaxID=320778 RepID=A0A0J1HDK9_9GAMM|nr:HGGxSTG domain-containing protein [Photobacterium ganghwense]KLV09714.1 hypothetical protein ABT57_10940 [Photobacterium ganghwense]PSU04730.1 hypothetical protein C9I92_23225 [Photobacterium ganghwense]